MKLFPDPIVPLEAANPLEMERGITVNAPTAAVVDKNFLLFITSFSYLTI